MPVSRVLLLLVAIAGVSLRAQTSVPTVGRTIATQALAPGGPTTAINLADYFGVPGVTGQVVQFDTVMGKFDVEMRADAAPLEVANFLGYVQRGDYTKTFFHRSASLEQSGGISIVQGGGYTWTQTGAADIATQNPVPLEYNLPNERGTIAAARTTDINSATSQWYFNVRDNTTILGPGNGGGYTVFGRVVGTGMTVVDAIAALQRVNAGAPFDQLPVRNYTAGSNVTGPNLVIVNSVTTVPLFADASGNGFVTVSVAQNTAPNVVTAALTGSVLALTPGASGSSSLTLRATDVNGNTADTTFTVTVASVPPAFTTQPTSFTMASGNTVVLSGTAAAAVSYQWQHNGADVFGATNSSLVVKNLSSTDAGTYKLIARNSLGSTASNPATLTVSNVSAGEVGRLVNLSIRSNAGTGDQTLIVGFALGGSGVSGSAPLLLRAVGPSLAQFGVSGYLSDPMATLYSGSTVIGSNNNWGGDATVDARAKQVGAFAFTSASSLDAALAVSESAGSYTMQVTGNGGTGNALAEIYDATAFGAFTATTPRLVNVSARTQVGTGDSVLITGFVIRGSTAKTLLIRATGPALAGFGVAGTLADPKLQLYAIGVATPLAENNDWGGDPQIAAAASSVGAFPLTNGASKDAALLVTLPPGNYTAQVSGADGGTGVALVEVYEVP